MKKTYLLLPLVCLTLAAYPQKKADRKVLTNLQAHVSYLASDKLEGRRTGTAGEQLAAAYIAEQMKQAGLAPKGSEGYLQSFLVSEGRASGTNTLLTINQTAEKDFVPLPFSAAQSAKGEVLPGVHDVDNVWIVDVKEWEDGNNPHGPSKDIYIKKAKEAKQNGATGIVFFNGPEDMQTVRKWLNDKNPETLTIPAIWAGAELSKKLGDENANGFQVELAVDFQPSKRTGTNVVGYIDNGAKNTVIIGAHYDHIGYGEDRNSRSDEKAVHNGADDNASGTAALLELGRMLKASKLKNNNYAFVAFSGEEIGLLGSRYFAESNIVPAASMNYMVNMDMVGRLDNNNKGLQIGGIGTSPSWGELIKKSLPATLKVNYDSSGTGPSDHTSFYRKDVPVLFFFTGTHDDYHKPADDADKINYTGELTIVKLVYDIVNQANAQPKLTFTKTAEVQAAMPKFSVTLGIMPDYSFNKDGLRVDGVSKGKAAEKIGILPGDVITQLGDVKVTDIDTYMEALAKFKKGDATKVSVKRGNAVKVFEVLF